MYERIGPYEILRRLGIGGMGTAYLALDQDGHTVAVKVIHPHVAADEKGLRRLEREGSAIRRIRSPFVAEFLDIDLLGTPPYIVTRYVQGRSLRQIVADQGPVQGLAVHGIAIGLAAALDAIHAAGVVHRDITPHNVLVEDGTPIVIDFGIAYEFGATRMTSAQFIGTPGFMAPEVLDGQRPEPAADVFSWGATVAYAATGRNCFGTGSVFATLRRCGVQNPDLDGVPSDLLPAVRQALQRDPGARPTAQELLGAISSIAPEISAPRTPTRSDDALLSDLWVEAGKARIRGDLQEAHDLYERARMIAARSGDVGSQMFASYQLGMTAESGHDYSGARGYYDLAWKQAAAKGATSMEILALHGLERLARLSGDPRAAEMYSHLARKALDDKQDLRLPHHPTDRFRRIPPP